MICLYLFSTGAMSLDFQSVYKGTRCKLSTSLQFEIENDFTLRAIGINRSHFPIF